MNIARRTMTINGQVVHYRVAGQGEPIVFVHGLSGSSTWWNRNIPTLARHYQLYLVDLPGFGSMRHLAQHFKLEESAAWLDRWMQAVGIEKAHLVGHSMGGYICMALTALRPEKVQHLILVDSIGIPHNEPLARLQRMALRAIGRTTPAFWPYIAYDYLRAGPAMVRIASQQIIALQAASIISAVQVPTLLIWGARDDLVPLKLGYQLHQQLAGSRLLVFHNSNHFPMFDRPRDFNTALVAFLEGEEIGILATQRGSVSSEK